MRFTTAFALVLLMHPRCRYTSEHGDRIRRFVLPTRGVIFVRLTRLTGHALGFHHMMVMSQKTTILPPRIPTLSMVIAVMLTRKVMSTVGRTTNRYFSS